MKILFLLSIGLDRQATSGHLLVAMIEQLCKSGHSVHILQQSTGGSFPPIPEQLKLYAVTTDCIPFNAANKENFVARFFKELCYIQKCMKFITEEYDAVFIQSTPVGGFAVKAVRSKLKHAIVTFNIQDIFPYNVAYCGIIKKGGLIFKIMSAQQRYAYTHSDHIITISEDMKDLLESDGTPKDKIEVIYNWSYQDECYDHSKLDFRLIAHMFSKDYFNVVYAGNIGVMQNVDILIEAARLMGKDADVWFSIIGDGIYKEKLQVRAKQYGITRISFWPMQPSEMAPLIYSSADINVIPLAPNIYKTALPSKTATCMACGRPIIFAIGEGSKFGQKVKRETGCPIVESNDAEALVLAIRKIKDGKLVIKTNDFFVKNMLNSNNSIQYEKIITKERNRVRE